jgi:peptide chain release factor 2
MKDLKQKIKDLARTFKEIRGALSVEEKKKRLLQLEARTTDPSFWEDQKNAKRIMQEFGDLKKEIDEIEKLDQDITALLELSKNNGSSKELTDEVKKSETKLNKLKLSSFLSGPYDAKNAIVSIHAGQGGTEAMDWASMLYRMYLKFSERRRWKTQVIDLSEGEEAGIKSVTFAVTGPHAYGYLKGEAGTHRLVRQSPFNADKLRQTSFALVEVLPELEEVDLPDIKIGDEDLEWQFFRASTQGGQNVQKVSTAVRLKHKPSGVVVTSQAERHQEQNRKIALGLLRSKLWLLEQAKAESERRELKGEWRPASWGNQIRSYVLHPYKMVKDLRTDIETGDTEAVLDGDLDQFIEAELKMAHP